MIFIETVTKLYEEKPCQRSCGKEVLTFLENEIINVYKESAW